MNRNDIFNLLLIVLLICNEKSDCDPAATASNLNEVILTALLMSSCSNNDTNNCNNSNNTTF